jgi:hypothetical protein
MQDISINYRNTWKHGASSGEHTADGGFSSKSIGIDLISEPGVMNIGATLTLTNAGSTLTNMLTGDVVALCVPETVSDRDCIFLTTDSNNKGRLVRVTSAATEALAVATDSGARTYTAGVSDVIEFNAEIFWTSNTDIAKGASYDWMSATASSGNNLTSGVPHMMTKFDSVLYITDGRYIHTWDGSAFSYQALDVPLGYIITAISRQSV